MNLRTRRDRLCSQPLCSCSRLVLHVFCFARVAFRTQLLVRPRRDSRRDDRRDRDDDRRDRDDDRRERVCSSALIPQRLLSFAESTQVDRRSWDLRSQTFRQKKSTTTATTAATIDAVTIDATTSAIVPARTDFTPLALLQLDGLQICLR